MLTLRVNSLLDHHHFNGDTLLQVDPWFVCLDCGNALQLVRKLTLKGEVDPIVSLLKWLGGADFDLPSGSHALICYACRCSEWG